MIIAMPRMTTAHVTGTFVTTEITSAVANSRTPSASERVARKISADRFFTRGPKRRCSSSYEVNSSPRKYAGMNSMLTRIRPMT